ncbi:phage virion morphogenesis protein [Hypericibacter sp.]|uniref:phage virion morphogenesis protein n=1 Tax=Hypericibacter sp. TaxID=2705401 RepID=UPI003D6C8B8C
MSGLTFTVELDDKDAQAGLQRLIALGQDLEPIMDEIGGMLETSTQMRFERGIGPDGQAWRISLRAAEEHGRTLVDSARLLNSITHAASSNSVEVGTNVIYAAVHQFGATIMAKAGGFLRFMVGGRWARKKSVTIPARPFLGIDNQDRDGIEQILGDHVRAAWSPHPGGA